MTGPPRRVVFACELAVPLAYLVLAPLFSAHFRQFETNPDEGINLVKAMLVARGDALYDAVWSDQPPAFTYLLRLLFAVVGESVVAARLLVLAMSSLLLWACARFARLAWGPREALASSLVILLLPSFQLLSVSVMVGLPALSLAAVALVCAAEASASRRLWLPLASGILLALSVLTKLFTLLLVPILLGGLVRESFRRRRPGPALAWVLGFGATLTIGFQAFVGPAGFEQLVPTHVVAAIDPWFRDGAEFGPLGYLRPLVGLLALALVGAVTSMRRRRRLALYPVAWALVALPALALHRPIWFHHLLFLTIPAALLAAAGGVRLLELVGRFAASRAVPWKRMRVPVACAAGALAIFLVANAGRWRLPRPPGREAASAEALVERIRALAGPGDVMFTDLPMFAFRAGIPVPPATAVLSAKRLWSGLLTEADLRATLESERPAIVLLGRFTLPELEADVRASHRLVFVDDRRQLYVPASPEDAAAARAWARCLEMPPAWYAGPEARRLAEQVLAAQHADGGWAKDEDRTRVPSEAAGCEPTHLRWCSTIDNGATTTELRFLARVFRSTRDARLAAAVEHGLDHVLGAQQPGGGWPQVPAAPAGDYRAAITLNDDAMAHVLELLDAVDRDPAFSFVDAARRARAREAFARGVDLLVRAQIRVAGVATGWCAQHDPATLEPVAGRSYEPPSLSGHESVGVVRVLMGVAEPSPEVVAAIEAAVAWLRRARLDGARSRWARFYALDAGTPLFPDRGGRLAASFDDLGAERRAGYRYFTDAPFDLLQTDYPRWRAARDRAR